MRKFEFLGMFKCGECGRSITAEKKVKKSGLSYVYYRCTKKGTTCSQKYLEEREFIKQVDSTIQKVALNDEWANKMLKQLEKDRKELDSRFRGNDGGGMQDLRKELDTVENKLDRLLSVYLSGALEIPEYQNKKKELLEKKISLKERLANLGQEGCSWLEPMKEWILSSQRAKNLETLEEKRNFLQKIGSNFILAGRKVSLSLSKPYLFTFSRSPSCKWSG